MDKGRILLVDNEAVFLRVMELRFQYAGFRTEIARNTNEAQQRLGDESGFDLLVTDLLMPGGNGLDLARRLRDTDRWRDLPLIFVSGGGLSHELDQAREAFPEAGVFAKPVRFPELIDCATKLILQRSIS